MNHWLIEKQKEAQSPLLKEARRPFVKDKINWYKIVDLLGGEVIDDISFPELIDLTNKLTVFVSNEGGVRLKNFRPLYRSNILRLIDQSEKINELFKGGIYLEPKGVK